MRTSKQERAGLDAAMRWYSMIQPVWSRSWIGVRKWGSREVYLSKVRMQMSIFGLLNPDTWSNNILLRCFQVYVIGKSKTLDWVYPSGLGITKAVDGLGTPL